MATVRIGSMSEWPSVLGWVVCTPFLVFWPILSTMPVFTLLGRDVSGLAITVNVLLFLTGFWAFLSAFCFYAFALGTDAALQRARPSGTNGLLLAIYSVIWTGFYYIVAIASR